MGGPSRRSDGRARAQQEFLSEVEEILERLREDESDLAEQRAADRDVDPEVVNRLFRSAHSLKSLAGMFGLEALAELAHRLEDVLDRMRLGRIPLHAPAAARIGEAVALIGALIGGLRDGREPEDARERVDALAARLEAEAAPEAEDADALHGLELDPSLLRALTEYEEHRLRENVRRGRRILLVEATFEVLSFDEGLAELTREVRGAGEVISTLPSPGAAAESQIRFGLLVASALSARSLSARIEVPHSLRLVHEPERPELGPAPPAPPPAAASAGASRDGEAAEIESLKSVSGTVRVDIRKLDELMNRVGELSIQRAALGGIARRLAADPATKPFAEELDKVRSRFERRLAELQSGVLDVRMVPLRQVFEKLARVVRRLRRELDKDVRLQLRGADTELDKLIVEELVDPLVHVVRNAFDHGIESAADREAAGKPPEGLIRVEAYQRGNHVVIRVSDDGCGIDPDALRRRAAALGLVAPEQTLTRKEALDLIFLPGFTTRERADGTSGRGVGMDVVRQNLADLAGVVDVDASPGRGTSIAMTLPITLAIVQALIVVVGEERYAIPINAVLETGVLEAERVQRSEDREILDLRGEPLLLRWLRDELQLGPDRPPRSHVVVIGLGESRVGLVVDRLEGEQDAVVKAIQGPVRSIRGIAGATELGDHGAVLVLDPAALVEDAGRRREAA